MATMKRSEDFKGEEVETSVTRMAGYYSKTDAIRGKEFPMLQGRHAELTR